MRSTLCHEPAFLGSSSGPFWILLQDLKALPAASLLPHFTSETRNQGYGGADIGIKYRARGGWDIVFGLAVQGYSPPRDLKAAGHRASVIIKQRAVDSGTERTSSYAVQGSALSVIPPGTTNGTFCPSWCWDHLAADLAHGDDWPQGCKMCGCCDYSVLRPPLTFVADKTKGLVALRIQAS